MAIEFENKPLRWDSEGAEPSEELKTTGFQAGYKPPAQIFNYQLHNTSACLTELQNQTSDLDDIKVDKVKGKGLSTNDFTNEEKAKLAGIDKPINESLTAIETDISNLETDVTNLDNTKANADLTNVDNTVFAEKAASAGGTGFKIGKDLTGQTVSIDYDGTTETTVTAGTNAEIFNDFRERTTYNYEENLQKYLRTTGNVASGDYSHAEGEGTTASGHYSHSEGRFTVSSGLASHAEGEATQSTGGCTHAEGSRTQAIFHAAHAEGWYTVSSGDSSHSEGIRTTASGGASHSEGFETIASGKSSHAEGEQTTASGLYAHSEGKGTTASETHTHAEGCSTTASGIHAHSEGSGTKAEGGYSHSEGYYTTASGTASHAGGYQTIASHFQLVHGKWNKASNGATAYTSSDGDIFIMGNGTGNDTRSNAFRVTTAGKAYGLSNFSGSGAGVAELYEWKDGNPDNEDRRGLFVTLDGDKIRIASPEDDYILGTIDPCPYVVGDVQSEIWKDMYLKDVFGEKLIETVEVEETTDENGQVIPAHTEKRWVLNPEYDPSQEYVSRDDRSEFAAITSKGKVVMIDDGSCQVNKYCTVGENGIATASEDNYAVRVMERIDDTHIRVYIDSVFINKKA